MDRDFVCMYGKQTETAIAAVGYLAELWRGATTRRVSAADIADARGLQRPFVAKLLSALSQAGVVSGSPGPEGGYALAKPPAEIRLRDVWLVFERPEAARDDQDGAASEVSALQQRIQRVHDAVDQLLDETTFEVFVTDAEESEESNLGGRLASLPPRSSPNGQSGNGHAGNGHPTGSNGTGGH